MAVTIILVSIVVYKLTSSSSDAELASEDITDTIPHQAEVAVADEEKDDEGEGTPYYADVEFPKTGKTVSDFVPAPYVIAMEAKGLLNEDDLEDVALVLQNEKDSTDLRPTLVLLKQKNGGYQCYGASWSALGAAYINGDFQHYDSEDITIDSARNLNITTFGSGPVGNQDLKYRFINNRLVLVAMETYHAGAGGQTEMKFDFLNSIVAVTEVNTMKENMPSTTTKSKLSKRKPYFFESTDPDSIPN